jgi:uncharacterized protein YndB with AHSA1/START domain
MPDIKHSIQTSAAPEQVYLLVSKPNGLGRWWATDITEAGGTVDLGFFRRATIYRLRLVAEDPPRRAEWICDSGDEWNGTHIAFEMEPAAPGTLIRFTHAGWRTESAYFRSCNTTWGELMFRLKAAAEGRTPGPLFTAEGWVA